MTSFVLKIIAIICMFCDHYGDAVVGHFSTLNYIGRIAFPIFAFQIAQGYIHTKNVNKYIIRLFIFAIVSQIPYYLFLNTFNGDFSLNVIFTLLIGLLAIYAFDKISNKFLGICIAVFLSATAQLVQVDYGAYGIIIIFIFYIFSKLYEEKEKYSRKKYLILRVITGLSFVLATIVKYYINFLLKPGHGKIFSYSMIFTSLALLPICLYNDKQGPKVKYLFYIFYPLHLLILFLVHYYII